MASINLDSSNFETTVLAEGIVLIDCWASWCGACKTFAPIFEAVSEAHPKHIFAKVDTEAEKDLTAKLGIEHIPTLLLYREGILLFRQPGYYEQDELQGIVQQAESLDMNAVREQLAAEEPAKSDGTES